MVLAKKRKLLRPRGLRAGGRAGAAAGVILFAIHGSANAFQFDLGDKDFSLDWTNTIRYNLGLRAQGIDSRIGNSVINAESDYRARPGQVTTNRVDLLSELDFAYKNTTGVRVSFAGWYDSLYGGGVKTNPGIEPISGLPYSQIGSYANNQYSSLTKRYYEGPSGELLDAFGFTKFDVGDVPVSVKVGQHSVFWGEALYSVNGIAYSQGPVDFRKAFSVPGSSAKELFLPVNRLGLQSQVTDTVSLAAEYMFDWRPSRLPEGGTYLGFNDILLQGPDRLPVVFPGGAAFIPRGNAANPHNHGAFGVSAKLTPAWLDGTAGFYYRRFDETFPWLVLAPGAANYHAAYAEGTQLFGASLSKEVGGVSVGAELVYKRNAALTSALVMTDSGARGDTAQMIVNMIGLIGKTPLFGAASWNVELSGMQYLNVRSNAAVFNAVGYDGCPSGDKWNGCATKRSAAINLGFTPTWYQVFPGVDLSMPTSFGIGLIGNDPTVVGGWQGVGSFSVGLSADVRQKFIATLAYNGYTGKPSNGPVAGISDRGWVSLTLKSTF